MHFTRSGTSTHEIELELETHGAIDEWSIAVDGRDESDDGWEPAGNGVAKLIPVTTTDMGMKIALRCAGEEGAWCRLVIAVDGVPQFPPLRAFVKGGSGMRTRWFTMPQRKGAESGDS